MLKHGPHNRKQYLQQQKIVKNLKEQKFTKIIQRALREQTLRENKRVRGKKRRHL